MMKRFLKATLLNCALIASPALAPNEALAQASAQASAQDRAQANALFEQALAEYKAQHFREALPLFEASQAADPGAGTLLYIGECHRQLGHIASAWGTFKEAQRLAQRIGDKRDKLAADKAAELEKLVSHATIEVADDRRVKGLELKLDGRPFPQELWGTSVPLDPGTHTLELSAPDHELASIKFTVAPDGARIVQLAPALSLSQGKTELQGGPMPDGKPRGTEQPGSPEEKAPTPVTPRPLRTMGYVAGGAGVVLGAAGVVVMLLARSDGTNAGDRGDRKAYDDAHGHYTLGAVAAGVGGALAITGAVLVLTSPNAQPSSSRLSIEPRVAAGTGGVWLGGTFLRVMPIAAPLAQTIDPTSRRPTDPGRHEQPLAVIEIVFHPDLSRIGERYVLGPVGAEDSILVIVGRDEPAFARPGLPDARPLLDPCLSRQQVSITWSPTKSAFRIEAAKNARRPVQLLDFAGAHIGSPPRDADPGTLVALGDRTLLQLSVRPPSSELDDLQLLGQSGPVAALRHRIRAIANVSDTVLIEGETGAGKELVARAIHASSPRRDHAFVALNCAALPEPLIESELFGYVRSAFSGANQARKGLFHAAHGGTLFLDEIGEMPPTLQAKLLRALELRQVRPVGATSETLVNVHVLVATHRDLAADVREGRFRADLFGRIEAPKLLVPPLRERRDDVALLFASFLWRRTLELARRLNVSWQDTPLAALWNPADAYPPLVPLGHVLGLLAYDWPRNVRELDKHTAEVAAALLQGIALPAPPAATGASNATARAFSAPETDATRPRPDKAEIERLLETLHFNQAEAARQLGVPYATLDRWLRELGVVRPKDLSREQIAAALAQSSGDIAAMAQVLRVSPKGLKQRLNELGLG